MRWILPLFLTFNLYATEGDLPVWGEEVNAPDEANAIAQKTPPQIDLKKMQELLPLLSSIQGEGELSSEGEAKFIDAIIENNPFTFLSSEQVEVMISQGAQGSRFEKVLESYPKLKTFLAKWVIDEKAMPKLLSLTKKKKRLRNLGIFSFVFVIFGFLLASKMTQNEPRFLIRVIKKSVIRLGASLAGLALFYFAFYRELSPTVQLMKQYLF